jgi:phosphatidate phosphatase APP1
MLVDKRKTAMLAAVVTVALLSSVAIHGLVAPSDNTAAAAATPKKHPGIKLQPDSGSPGTSVTILGSEFKAKSTVKISFDGKTLKTDTKVTTNADGSFTAHVKIPNNAKPGNHTIKASTGIFGIFNNASATFTVKKSS